jgi:hypothetical protein
MLITCRRIFLLLVLSFLISGYTQAQCKDGVKEVKDDHNSHTNELDGVGNDDGVLYGKEINQDIEAIAFEQLIAGSDEYSEQEIVVMGNISDVCQSSGCWLLLSNNDNSVRVKTDHSFFVPKGCSGKNAKIQGVFKMNEISEEQARHYNDNSKDSNINSEDIIGPQKVYEIVATGVVLLQDTN